MLTDMAIGLQVGLILMEMFLMSNTIILGSDVGKAKGTLRSNPGEGQHFECPCKVNLYITTLWKFFFESQGKQ